MAHSKRDKSYDQELAGKVLNLRRAGVPFDVIADELQLTPQAAKALFDKAIGAHDPKFLRALEADRLDRLHSALWARAVKGEVEAIDRVLRISERRERLTALPRPNEHLLRKAFDASAATSAQVHQEVDQALVESGRKIADRVDQAVAEGDGQEVTKALYLVPHMLNVLREMLATPASRQAAGITAKREGGKLAELRSIHGQRRDRETG